VFLWRKIVYARAWAWFGCGRDLPKGPDSACLHFAVHWFLCRKNQTIHTTTSTARRFQHGAMFNLCRERYFPQPNRRSKPLQPQKATATRLQSWGILKQQTPHKEQKNSCPLNTSEGLAINIAWIKACKFVFGTVILCQIAIAPKNLPQNSQKPQKQPFCPSERTPQSLVLCPNYILWFRLFLTLYVRYIL
jgi:hypothetical protein